MKTKLSYWPFFLFLLPLFFLLHRFADNAHLVLAKDMLWLLGKYWMVAALCFALFTRIFRSPAKGALFTFLLFTINFFSGHLLDATRDWIPRFSRYSVLLPFLALTLAALFFYLKNQKTSFHRLFLYLNTLFLAFVVYEGIRISLQKPPAALRPGKITPSYVRCDTCATPDIYLIVADEYAGNEALKDLFHFDNRPFEELLRQRGFNVLQHTVSNYHHTAVSIASLLRMDYLKELNEVYTPFHEKNMALPSINDNPVTDFLKDHHYTFNNFSIFRFGEKAPLFSTMFFPGGRKRLTYPTLFSRIYRDIGFHFILHPSLNWLLKNDMQRGNEKAFHETLRTAGKQTTPTFTYTHLLIPHEPYLFREDGSLNRVEATVRSNKDSYIGYLKYGNGLLLRMVDSLQNLKNKPIILLIGDHGFRTYSDTVHMKYNFLNFSAIYLPDKNYQGFYDGMSLVNIFRVLFNNRFNQRFPLLPDSTLFLVEKQE